MPLLDNEVSVLQCKGLGLRQILHFESLGFAQLDTVLNGEYRFTATMSNMDVDRTMLIAIEEEQESVLLEDLRHVLSLAGDRAGGQP